jgi:hypothetical protein
MIPDPLRNIRLGRHRTLSQRTLPGQLKALFLAKVSLSQSANRNDNLDHCLPRDADPQPNHTAFAVVDAMRSGERQLFSMNRLRVRRLPVPNVCELIDAPRYKFGPYFRKAH